MERIDGMSMDLEQAAKEKLKSVFPECFSEGKLDIDKLLNLCGEYIDDDFEKYEFKWKGKNDCLKLAQKRSMGTLRPCVEESVDWENTKNLYIEGDNLEVLKILQTSYYRQVKMIYIDPPYNTGKDFVYADDFADPIARYKEVTSQTTKSNPETMGRYHTNWLNMMYPRLRLASNLLRDDGIIFISIDDNEVDNLKKLCNEVFGEENFLSMFCWRTDGNFDNQAKIKICHEYILLYAKCADKFPAPPVIDPAIPQTSKLYKSEIRNTIIKNGAKNPISEVIIPAGFPCDFKAGIIRASDVIWPKYDKDIKVSEGVTTENVVAVTGWASKAQLMEYISNNYQPVVDTKGQTTNFVITKTGAIEAIKKRLDQQSHVISILNNLGGSQKASISLGELSSYFDFPKPVELIKYLLQMNNGKEFVCLDFFSGSATTAHAVMQLNAEDGGNRRFIMVQLPELCDEKSGAYKAGYKNICEIGKERIRRAGTKIAAEWEEKQKQLTLENGEVEELDTGFKVFKLDTSNLLTWDTDGVGNEDFEQLQRRLDEAVIGIKNDRTALDMVYEILLKTGFHLTEEITELEINGKTVYSVGDAMILICLADNITVEDVEEMAEYAPAYIVFAEKSFRDMSAMENAELALQDTGIEMRFF